jgi:hypothetical protein
VSARRIELTPHNAFFMFVKVPLAATALGIILAIARLPVWADTTVLIAVVLAGVVVGVRRSMVPNN